MKYLLDTNIITTLIKGDPRVLAQLEAHLVDGVYLCQLVFYEAMRGLLWKNATTKIQTLERLRLRLGWFQLLESDWEQAGVLWAQAVSHGRQLADIDLLIAALALRQDAIVVTDDQDFDALPVKRENWRA
jgi:tRNA(fMet)-specific endonuclease VapC